MMRKGDVLHEPVTTFLWLVCSDNTEMVIGQDRGGLIRYRLLSDSKAKMEQTK